VTLYGTRGHAGRVAHAVESLGVTAWAKSPAVIG
jgi:hypothetical protein